MPLKLTHVQRCIISMIVYIVCFILEIIAFVFLHDAIDSDCIAAREISSIIWWSMLFIFVPIIPDILFCLMGILISEPYYAALGGCYNIVMGLICIIACLFGFLANTGCGNPIQSTIEAVAIIELFAGIIHLVFVWFVHENLDEGEVLFRKTC